MIIKLIKKPGISLNLGLFWILKAFHSKSIAKTSRNFQNIINEHFHMPLKNGYYNEIRGIISSLETKSPENLQELKQRLFSEVKVSKDPDFLLSFADFICNTRLFLKDFKDLVQKNLGDNEFSLDVFIELGDFLSDPQKTRLYNNLIASKRLDKTNQRISLLKGLNFFGINYRLFSPQKDNSPSSSDLINFYEMILSQPLESPVLVLNALRSVITLASIPSFYQKKEGFPSKDRLIKLIIKAHHLLSGDINEIPTFFLIPLIMGFDTILSKSPEELLVPIYDEFFKSLLQRIQIGECNAFDLQMLCERFIKSHEGESKSIFIEARQKEVLVSFHKQFLDVHYKMFFGKAQVKKPPKVILTQIPKLLKLANLIEFEEKVFYEAIEESIFLFKKYKEQELFLKTFISTAYEVFQMKNLGKSFYSLKKNTNEILRIFFQNVSVKNESLNQKEVIIKSLRVAKMAGSEEELEKNRNFALNRAMDFIINNDNRLDIMNFLDLFSYFLEEINQETSHFENIEVFLSRMLNGILKIQSYHYIFDMEAFLAYKVNLPLELTQEKICYLQNLFHCFAVIQMKFAEMANLQNLHNKIIFFKTLKNYFAKYMSFFSTNKQIKYLTLSEYQKIFNISKEGIKIPKLSVDHPIFFPIINNLIIDELEKGLNFCVKRGNSMKEFELLEWIKYFGSLRFILNISGFHHSNDKIETFYNDLLLTKSLQDDGSMRIFRFYQIFFHDSLFKDRLESKSSLLTELQNLLSMKFSESNRPIENIKVTVIIFLLKLLQTKGLKDEKLWKSITEAYSKENKEFDNLDDLKFNSFGFSETKTKIDLTNLKTSYQKLDPQRINGANAYLAIMSSPLNQLENETIFHFEKVISKDIQSLDLVKLGNLADKFNKWEYQALKLGIAFRKILNSCFLAQNKDFSVYQLQAINKILAYLMGKNLISISEIQFPNSNFMASLQKNLGLAVDLHSIFIENKLEDYDEILRSFAQIFMKEILKQPNLLKEPSHNLLFIGLISLVDEKLVPLDMMKQCLDFNYQELMKNKNFIEDVPRIVRIYLKNKKISDKTVSILETIVKNCFQNEENYKYSIKIMIELSPLVELKHDLFNLLLQKLKLNTQIFEKLNIRNDKKLIIRTFLFILECNLQNNNEIQEIYSIIRKKLIALPIDSFSCEDIKFILKNARGGNLDKRLLSSLERASLLNYRENQSGLVEIYLEFCKNGLGSSLFLENVEKRIFAVIK